MELNTFPSVKIEEGQPESSKDESNKKYGMSDGRKSSVNDTKNIPKNFGKAIIAFISKNIKVTQRCLEFHGMDTSDFLKALKLRKKNLHSIKELRSLWLDD